MGRCKGVRASSSNTVRGRRARGVRYRKIQERDMAIPERDKDIGSGTGDTERASDLRDLPRDCRGPDFRGKQDSCRQGLGRQGPGSLDLDRRGRDRRGRDRQDRDRQDRAM